MVAKPPIEDGARNRAGMSLARAQRLSDKAKSTERSGATPKVLLFGVALAALGGVGFLLQSNLGTPAVDTAEIIATDAVAAPAIEDIQITSAQEAVAEEIPAETFAPRPILAPCIARIENDLTALQQADAQAMAWEIKRARIRTAAQSVLNCELAGVSFEGDFELTATDFADLHVAWDRTDGHLTFTIVDSVAPEDSPLVLTEDGQPIEFIVH
ncbi:hypothetical protein SLH49_02535 [Cognatiyoonia sp. IB215446]|uniref:hypothetical protein n=1 Tax=Cognatiyoonia sp. IB215446 TaxID=3097355 RepID=UPI002A126E60|nr:hypothetical protein [Cognatiyoonia sp. IB215446]MDX8346853.1 hypothetical protein [Cognatiyoonia sp. IB215446]